MRIIKYDRTYKTLWNDFIYSSKNGTFLFDRDFMEYHSHRFEDHSLLIFDRKDCLISVFPANKNSDSLCSHDGLTYGGMIFREGVSLFEVMAGFRKLLKYCQDQKIVRIRYKSVPPYYYRSPSYEEVYIFFLLESSLIRTDTSLVLPLTSPSHFQTRKIRNIKKAEAAKVEIRKSIDFGSFWNLILTPNLKYRYKTTPVHSLEEIQLLATKFPENIQLHEAWIADKPVAGTLLFISGETVHCQYISANEQGREVCALDFLFFKLIDKFKPTKKFFSLGISNENEGRKINKGLFEWKEGFGCSVFPHLFWEIQTDSYPNLEGFG